mgnify:CR=1 FL=1
MNLKFSIALIASVFLTACNSITVGDDEIGNQVLERAMPQKGNIVDAKHGKELWFAIGPMNGTKETPANGVASGHFFEDKTSLVSIQLNINVPEDGWFYRASLEGDNGAPPLELGHLTNARNDARHALRAELPNDIRAYKRIAIYKQKDGANAESAVRVGEGLLAVRER